MPAYLKGPLHHGLSYNSSSSSEMYYYSNVNYANCQDIRCSISGYNVFLGNNLVSWRSKKQITLSHSVAEVEY